MNMPITNSPYREGESARGENEKLQINPEMTKSGKSFPPFFPPQKKNVKKRGEGKKKVTSTNNFFSRLNHTPKKGRF